MGGGGKREVLTFSGVGGVEFFRGLGRTNHCQGSFKGKVVKLQELPPERGKTACIESTTGTGEKK